MSNHDESLSYGGYLQRIRLEKRISLEAVSEDTRIGLGTLKLIEKEDQAQLPAEVFVKGFLRAYARAIGADGDEAVKRYESRLKTAGRLSGPQAAAENSNTGIWWKLPIVLVVFAAVIFLSVWGISILQTQPVPKGVVEEQKLSINSEANNHQLQKEAASAKDTSTKIITEKWVLEVEAHQDTWMKIIIDDGDAAEYNLAAGDRLELKAVSNFNLLFGNAGGIEMKLNDKPVAISGKNGEIVTMQLP